MQKVELNIILMSASSDDTNLDYFSKNFISKQIKTTTIKKDLKISPEKIIKNDKLYLIHSLANKEQDKTFTVYYKLVN